MPFPPEKFTSSMSLSGFRAISTNSQYEELWFSVVKSIMNEYTVNEFDLSSNGSLIAAVIVSIVLSCIIGLVLVFGLVFAIN